MPIISVKKMKTVDERELQKKKQQKKTTNMKESCKKKQQKKNKQRQKGARGTEAIVKVWELNDFVVILNFWNDFLQFVCKASLIFKSNLELALLVILKQRESYESKHVAAECKCLKIWDLSSFLLCSSILVLKWRQVSPICFLLAKLN